MRLVISSPIAFWEARCSLGEMIVDEPVLAARGALVPLAHFEGMQEAQEHALVVLAMNLDCMITVDESGYHIHGEQAFASAIHEEFRLYDEEQKMKPEPAAIPLFRSGGELALVWIGVLLYCFARQLQNPGLVEGFLNSAEGVVGRGELYRPLTALFLHADLEHLLGNAVFGLIFGIFAAHCFGPFRAWVLILLSGFLGNLLNAWLHFPDEFRSLGASTAVFGALGLLMGSGLDAAWRSRSYRKGIRAFAPLMAGLMIFTMNGIGQPGTDTLAHLTGMIFGLFLGFPAANLLARKA